MAFAPNAGRGAWAIAIARKNKDMIITKGHAKRLIAKGTARELTRVFEVDGSVWMALDRYDVQRTDHYLICR